MELCEYPYELTVIAEKLPNKATSGRYGAGALVVEVVVVLDEVEVDEQLSEVVVLDDVEGGELVTELVAVMEVEVVVVFVVTVGVVVELDELVVVDEVVELAGVVEVLDGLTLAVVDVRAEVDVVVDDGEEERAAVADEDDNVDEEVRVELELEAPGAIAEYAASPPTAITAITTRAITARPMPLFSEITD